MSIEQLRQQILSLGTGKMSPEYIIKQIHDIPPGPTVDRVKYILEHCKDKIVLDLGCSANTLHAQIQAIAKKTYGADKEPCPSDPNFYQVDFDDVDYCGSLETLVGIPELLVCSEIIEHLIAPGPFLKLLLEYFSVSLLLTTPNAYSAIQHRFLAKKQENCNIAHVTWHSPRTLKTLLEKCGYEIKTWAYYNGDMPYSEGIIILAEPKNI